jgi:hypothetical protein
VNAARACDALGQNPAPGEMRISIVHIPDCPSAGRMRAEVEAALERTGATAVIEEIEGAYPSPTLLVDGVMVDGFPLGAGPACRIDVPAREQIASAILAAGVSGHPPARTAEGPE